MLKKASNLHLFHNIDTSAWSKRKNTAKDLIVTHLFTILKLAIKEYHMVLYVNCFITIRDTIYNIYLKII